MRPTHKVRKTENDQGGGQTQKEGWGGGERQRQELVFLFVSLSDDIRAEPEESRNISVLSENVSTPIQLQNLRRAQKSHKAFMKAMLPTLEFGRQLKKKKKKGTLATFRHLVVSLWWCSRKLNNWGRRASRRQTSCLGLERILWPNYKVSTKKHVTSTEAIQSHLWMCWGGGAPPYILLASLLTLYWKVFSLVGYKYLTAGTGLFCSSSRGSVHQRHQGSSC